MWELDCEESLAPKNWCFWTVVLEKTLESPLDCKEMQPVHSEGDHPWDFFGRNDAKAETPVLWPPHVKSWCFGSVVLEKTLESPMTARRSNQSILKEIIPGISLEGMMLKLKLQYFGHLMQRTDSFEKTLMLGKIEGRRRGRQRTRRLDGITDSTDMSLSKLWEILKDGEPSMLQFKGSQRIGHDLVTEQQHGKTGL